MAAGADEDEDEDDEEEDDDEEDEDKEDDDFAATDRRALEGTMVLRLHAEGSRRSVLRRWYSTLILDRSMLILFFFSSDAYCCKINAPASKFITAASS